MLRRLFTPILLIVGSLLLLEAGSWLIFRISFHERFSFAAAAQLRQARIAEAARTRPSAPDTDPAAVVAHPYLGFVYNPRYDPAGMLALHSVPVSDWGFLDDKSPLRGASEREVVIGIFGGSVALWFSVRGVDAMLEELAKLPQFHGQRDRLGS